jgi:hypothetical protein
LSHFHSDIRGLSLLTPSPSPCHATRRPPLTGHLPPDIGRIYAYRCGYTHTQAAAYSRAGVTSISEAHMRIYADKEGQACMRTRMYANTRVAHVRLRGAYTRTRTREYAHTHARIRAYARVPEILSYGQDFALKILPCGRTIFVPYLFYLFYLLTFLFLSFYLVIFILLSFILLSFIFLSRKGAVKTGKFSALEVDAGDDRSGGGLVWRRISIVCLRSL